MIRKQQITQMPDAIYREMGWEWFLGDGTWKYITNELIQVSAQEDENFYEAAKELYEMFIAAGDFVLDNDLWEHLDIPANIIEMIKLTWNDERHYHLYSRFDFAGGLDGVPIKLLEFNADTPTTLPETSIIQWGQLKANGISEENQFNFVFEAIRDNFVRLKDLNSDLQPTLLVSAMSDAPEDDANVEVIGEAAKEAGFEVIYRYVEEVTFSASEGIFVQHENGEFQKCDFWFKLVPWEYIAYEEGELMDMLNDIVSNRLAVILNPAYTLLFQSKAILKYLWDLYPEHPLLLRTSFADLFHNEPYVKKVVLGREGKNVSVYDNTGRLVEEIKGEYENYDNVFQAFAESPKDVAGNRYQAGVFFATEPCGLGFRKSNQTIIDDNAFFVGHMVER